MTSILDALPYPFAEREAQDLQLVLTRLYPSAMQAIPVAERAGLDSTYLNAQQPPVYLWRDILLQAAQNGMTRGLVTTVRDLLNATHPSRAFLDDLLADRAPSTEAEPRNADGTPVFIAGDDAVSEPEALLYYDDLTLQIGRVPGLIATLQRLVALAPAVCRFVVDVHGAGMHGSGFRIASDLLLTNWHVLHDQSTGTRATAVTAEFGYEDDGQGGALAPTTIPCDVESVVTDKTDDWAVIRANLPLLDSWPILKLSEAVSPAANEPAYIIQHPGGDRKRLGFVRNQVSSFDDRVVHYLTDTQAGSSGSPVFDAQGRLIGLHHAGGTPQQVVGKPPMAKNEGIRIPRVVSGLAAQNVVTP
ncbi:MAG TPA: trypsin-like peptidase domain-containing protein [Gaiella sp.]|uniref:trypsin-like serine peptidase n=1 Tax=Gaiella sp. TaxID=2663207 RepID=UPI002D7F251A|nr:trypsin-like peptidase domain-containing protein [Gaiella sp.]HET9287132.1 trypsin-like peptidase domain-containing protein [Gaiella sp.]